jgi:uncharacterized protein YjbI with pentapeptide repeats
MILYYFTYMKQASFKIGERTSSTDERTSFERTNFERTSFERTNFERTSFERTNFETTSSTDERTSSTDKSDQNNITSKKPIKYVENIYYFK